MRWLLENVAPVKAAIEAGTALVGTVDAWLAWNLTGGAKAGDAARHVTDLTNASRTMLMDLHSATWSDDAMEALGVRSVEPALPQIISCAEPIGVVSNGGPLDGAPLTGCIGDQQAAMVGQRCFDVGQAKITYGTGAFLLVNAGAAHFFPIHLPLCPRERLYTPLAPRPTQAARPCPRPTGCSRQRSTSSVGTRRGCTPLKGRSPRARWGSTGSATRSG